MKKVQLLFCTLLVGSFIACNNEEKEENATSKDVDEAVSYATFGDKITPENAISAKKMLEKYNSLEEGDTIEVKFTGVIENVCQKKGCWMNINLSENESAFVRFKDYGFFMPFNAAESKAIINGKAFRSEVSIEELKHYAEDENKTQEEIDAIVAPEITYGFLADGVLIEE